MSHTDDDHDRAAAGLSDHLSQMIRDVYRYDDTLTAEQIVVALRGQTDETVTPEAVQAVLDGDADLTDATTAVE